MNAQREYKLSVAPACIIADGPQETDGDGGFEYTVCFGDDEGEVIDENRKAIWRLWDYDEVCRFGEQLARKYGLEFLNEACPA